MTDTSSTQPPQSLRAVFAAAEAQRTAVERGANMAASSERETYKTMVEQTLAGYETSERLVAGLSLFSSNESADDIATKHLPYLMAPYREAEVVQRLPTTAMAERRPIVKRARDAYERFLRQLDSYDLLGKGYGEKWEEYKQTKGTVTDANTDTDTNTERKRPPPSAAVAALADPAARRNAKIASYQAEKALREKLAVLQQRQQERREKRRRQRQRIRDAEGETKEDEDEQEDSDVDDDEDEEAARELYLAQIAYAVHKTFAGLEGLQMEEQMLARMPSEERQGGRTAGGLGDNRERQRQTRRDQGYSDRLESVDASSATVRRLQNTYGHSVATGAGPLLTSDGKPRQPFTILGSRAEMAKQVFRPGHNLPTMSIDEYLEEERRRGGIIEGGGPNSGLPPPPDEDNYEKADAETMKAREWDEFKEANPKGAGNTLNRG